MLDSTLIIQRTVLQSYASWRECNCRNTPIAEPIIIEIAFVAIIITHQDRCSVYVATKSIIITCCTELQFARISHPVCKISNQLRRWFAAVTAHGKIIVFSVLCPRHWIGCFMKNT